MSDTFMYWTKTSDTFFFQNQLYKMDFGTTAILYFNIFIGVSAVIGLWAGMFKNICFNIHSVIEGKFSWHSHVFISLTLDFSPGYSCYSLVFSYLAKLFFILGHFFLLIESICDTIQDFKKKSNAPNFRQKEYEELNGYSIV